MQHVPTKYRLTSCCLVNTRMHAAAMAATQQLVLFPTVRCLEQEEQEHLYKLDHISPAERLHITSRDNAQSVLGWLENYGRHTTSLHMVCFSQPLRQLPCPNLLVLKLDYGRSMQLGPAADGSPGLIGCCPNLTCLEVKGNIIGACEPDLLDRLISLVHLQRLRVCPSPFPLGGLSEVTLPCLAQLTHLYVRNLSSTNLAQLGALSGLQELCLAAPNGARIGAGSVPAPVCPATLTRLEFWTRGMEPGILSLIPGLRELDLEGPDEGPAEGPGSLFACIGQLHQLVHLYMSLDAWPPAGPAYAALTASSSLVRLGLGRANLPSGVWQHVFPANHKLLHLTCLGSICRAQDVENVRSSWGATDISCIMSCCPNLHAIIGMCLQHGQHVSGLHKLTGLVTLDVVYAACDVATLEESLSGLAALTSIERLFVSLSIEQDLSVASLLPLTSLTSLIELEFKCVHTYGFPPPHSFMMNDQEDWSKKPLSVELQQVGPSPDVWQQLLERCTADPTGQPAALQPGEAAD